MDVIKIITNLTHKNIFFAVMILLIYGLLAGCSTLENNKKIRKNFRQAQENVRQIQNTLEQQAYEQKLAKQKQVVVAPIPTWAKQQVSMETNQKVPLSKAIDILLAGTNKVSIYNPGVDQNQLVAINFKGSINESLKNLAYIVDYDFTYKKNHIIWKKYVSSTIEVHFIPGQIEYNLGSKAIKKSANVDADNGMIEFSENMDTNEYANLSGQFSVWKDVESAIKNMLSEEGRLTVLTSLTQVMVHDKPSRVRAIEEYMDYVNKSLSRQVMLKVVIAQIISEQENNLGLNWQAIGSYLNGFGTFNIASDLLNPLAPASGATNITATFNGGSQAILNALEVYSDVSIVTEPTLITTNNQVAELSVNEINSYIAQMSSTITDQGNVVSAITPGEVDAGVKIYMLPKIYQDKIYLQMSATLSEIKGIETIRFNRDQALIQTPSVDLERLNSRAIIKDRTTLILSGFRDHVTQDNQGKSLGSSLLGGHGTKGVVQELIFLITPVIIDPDTDSHTGTIKMRNPHQWTTRDPQA